MPSNVSDEWSMHPSCPHELDCTMSGRKMTGSMEKYSIVDWRPLSGVHDRSFV